MYSNLLFFFFAFEFGNKLFCEPSLVPLEIIILLIINSSLSRDGIFHFLYAGSFDKLFATENRPEEKRPGIFLRDSFQVK